MGGSVSLNVKSSGGLGKKVFLFRPLVEVPNNSLMEKMNEFFKEKSWIKRINIVKDIGFLGMNNRNELFLVLSEMLNWERHESVKATIFEVLRFAEPNKAALILIEGAKREGYAKDAALKTLSVIKGVRPSIAKTVVNALNELLENERLLSYKGLILLAISNFDKEKGKELALSFFKSKDYQAREFGVKAFGKLRYMEGIEKALKDENEFVRLEAVIELEKLKNHGLLKDAVNDESWLVRWRAVRAFGIHKLKGYKEILLKALDDEHFKVVSESIKWIKTHRIGEALPKLKRLSTEIDISICKPAIDAYKELTGEEPPEKSFSYYWLLDRNLNP